MGIFVGVKSPYERYKSIDFLIASSVSLEGSWADALVGDASDATPVANNISSYSSLIFPMETPCALIDMVCIPKNK